VDAGSLPVRCFAVAVGLLALAGRPTALAASERGSPAELLGVWRGSSLCADRERAPACRDEQVIYTFVVPEDPAAGVRLEADRVVDGERGRMYEIELHFSPASGRWEGEVRNARFHGLWRYEAGERELTGELLELPSRTPLRRMQAVRDRLP
jgi:hypothetical protein